MNRYVLFALLACCTPLRDAGASTLLFQSAEIYPPSSTGAWTGLIVDSQQFVGARFHFESPAVIDGIGGRFFSGDGAIYGAIVALTSAVDFPDSDTLSTADVLAHTLLTTPRAITDLKVPFGPIQLVPGDYLVLFGSGRFGATGTSAALYPLDPVPGLLAEQVTWSPQRQWRTANTSRPIRVTVFGTIVPEPSTVALASIVVAVAAFSYRRRAVTRR